MPLQKPKPVRMPLPFAMPQLSADDNGRRRALLMNREMNQDGGYSWNRPQLGLFERLRQLPPHKILGAFLALVMGCVIMLAFLLGMDSGITPGERIVYMEGWRGDRTAEDAVRDREEAMDRLRAEVAANRRAYEEALARQQALEAERAAARQATSN